MVCASVVSCLSCDVCCDVCCTRLTGSLGLRALRHGSVHVRVPFGCLLARALDAPRVRQQLIQPWSETGHAGLVLRCQQAVATLPFDTRRRPQPPTAARPRFIQYQRSACCTSKQACSLFASQAAQLCRAFKPVHSRTITVPGTAAGCARFTGSYAEPLLALAASSADWWRTMTSSRPPPWRSCSAASLRRGADGDCARGDDTVWFCISQTAMWLPSEKSCNAKRCTYRASSS